MGLDAGSARCGRVERSSGCDWVDFQNGFLEIGGWKTVALMKGSLIGPKTILVPTYQTKEKNNIEDISQA